MDYEYFIGMLKNYETARVRAFRGEKNSTIERVPNAFALMLPEMISILDRNLDHRFGQFQTS